MWSDQMNSIDGLVANQQTNTSQSELDSFSESNYSAYITSQLDLTSDSGVPVTSPPSKEKEASIDVTTMSYKNIVEENIPISKEQHAYKHDESDNGKTAVRNRKSTEVSRESRNHMITDFVMIAKTAYNLHSQQRNWIKVATLKESIMYESDLQSKMGVKYTPSRNTTLDGNKAFAKEIIARHSVSDIHKWTSGETTTHGEFCLLNYKLTSLAFDSRDQSSLCDELVNCFHKMLIPQLRNEEYIEAVLNGVKFELSKDDYPSAFKWIENRAKYLETKSVSGSSKQSNHGEERKLSKKKEPYPAVDDRLIEFMNTNLQVFVNREIESAKDEVPQMSDETKLTKFFFVLASEFLRRNKGWHNENSFTSPQHLAKLEELTGLKSRPSESLLTFNILKKSIDNFRSAFKQRYPKMNSQ